MDNALTDTERRRANLAYHRLTALFAARWSMGDVVRFHTAHKLTLMAHRPEAYSAHLIQKVASFARSSYRGRPGASESDDVEYLDAQHRAESSRARVRGRPGIRFERLQRVPQHRGVHRLDQVRGKACARRRVPILFLTISRDRHQLGGLRRMPLAHPLRHISMGLPSTSRSW
jgi:hypothetical protein